MFEIELLRTQFVMAYMALSRDIPLTSGGEPQGATLVAYQSSCTTLLLPPILEHLWAEVPLVTLWLLMVGTFDGALVLWSLLANQAEEQLCTGVVPRDIIQ